jgi:hypothetical protein
MKRFLRPHHYLRVMREQPEHLQSLYAVIFAGCVTMLLGTAILYFDYGFWRDRYVRTDSLETEETGEPNMSVVTTKSPGLMFSDFMGEVSKRLEKVNTKSFDVLDGKDSYQRE